MVSVRRPLSGRRRKFVQGLPAPRLVVVVGPYAPSDGESLNGSLVGSAQPAVLTKPAAHLAESLL